MRKISEGYGRPKQVISLSALLLLGQPGLWREDRGVRESIALRALPFTHSCCFLADVKPENIMCQTKNSTNVKLIDFGLATKLDPNEVVKISTGTAEFAAPEIVEREPVGFYTDMWAVGVLAYVLLSGLSPFAGDNDIETLKNVKACDWDFDEEAFKNVSNEAKDFIRRLLIKNKE